MQNLVWFYFTIYFKGKGSKEIDGKKYGQLNEDYNPSTLRIRVKTDSIKETIEVEKPMQISANLNETWIFVENFDESENLHSVTIIPRN